MRYQNARADFSRLDILVYFVDDRAVAAPPVGFAQAARCRDHVVAIEQIEVRIEHSAQMIGSADAPRRAFRC
jgi:hypothetical protein